MSKDKILKQLSAEVPANDERAEERNEKSENPLAEEQFTNRLVYSSTPVENEDLLLKSKDYQLIKTLYDEIKHADDMTFTELKIKALNFIDNNFESYRKSFDIPTELVALAVMCKDGAYYLSVNPRGYLCFYKDVDVPVNKRIAMYLVRSDADSKKKPKN